MKTTFTNLTSQEQDWLDEYLDGTISPDDFEKFQDRLLESADLRFVLRRYLSLDNTLQNEGGESGEEAEKATVPWLSVEPKTPEQPSSKLIRFPSLLPLAAAAGLAFLLGTVVMQWRAVDLPDGQVRAEEKEPSAQGFAVIERLFDAQWESDEVAH
ncbi:MAG: hypothetical protein AAF491_10050, partial [Verrucomicrobiota bacterium]